MSTGTKGPSNLYGNPSHKPTEKINFEYAKEFNEGTLEKHAHDHGKDLGLSESDSDAYKQMAIEFANDVDTENYDSFVDERGSTHKYDPLTKRFIIVSSDGYIVTFYIAGTKNYWQNNKTKKGKKK